MKKTRTIFLALLALLATGCPAPAPRNQSFYDAKAEQEVLVGHCDRNGLQSGEHAQWFNASYNEYEPDATALARIPSDSLALHEVMIVLGTWCSDSRREVPRFYKILDQLAFPPDQVAVVGLDAEKSSHGVDLSGLDIQKVPTFIVLRDGRELGRIIETPQASLELDLLAILGR